MKKSKRKSLSVKRRDMWDSPHSYDLFHLSVDKLKHMQRHVARKDRTIKGKLEEALGWRMYQK